MSTTLSIILCIAYIILAPFIGGILAGIDRKITARMQYRVGPPIMQPIYDVLKLFSKEKVHVSSTQGVYVIAYFVSCVVAGAAFFAGANFLLVIFILTLGSLFFIMAAYSTRSPYSEVGAEREMLQVMAYEPMVLLMAVGFYMACGSFDVAGIIAAAKPAIIACPLLFVGFVFVLIIKFRKSPFDLSMSHHAHQEIVKGITTEISGPELGLVEVAHWYENVMFMGWLALFVMWAGGWLCALIVVITLILVYTFIIWVDNNYARVKWKRMLKQAWWLSLLLGGINLAIIPIINYFLYL